jgi:prephenate dehydrogenase
MTIQLTIIGLGQIGASIGLALANHTDKITRIGSDIDGNVMREAQKSGAVDKTISNLNVAVKNADLVILALPMDQVGEIMEVIAPQLKDDTVLLDTAPVKVKVGKWVEEFLPEGCWYVGLTPVLNPLYLHNEGYGIAAAKADLFQDGMFGVVTPYQSNPQAVKLATDLIQLLGATPLFVDIYENDGLMAATHLLPQLVSIGLLNATLDQPGWKEARKVAGRAFAEATGPAAHLDDAEALESAINSNKDNVVRKLDDVIATLQDLRLEIAQDDTKALATRIKNAKTGVNQWWLERGRSNWIAEELPQADTPPPHSGIMGNLFGFGFGRKKKKDE